MSRQINEAIATVVYGISECLIDLVSYADSDRIKQTDCGVVFEGFTGRVEYLGTDLIISKSGRVVYCTRQHDQADSQQVLDEISAVSAELHNVLKEQAIRDLRE